ncbi:MAG: hypothetical protein JXR49_16830 [Acidobacteria bacterium]|nr:hypothetical protein [Acidobacteriota bacterium]
MGVQCVSSIGLASKGETVDNIPSKSPTEKMMKPLLILFLIFFSSICSADDTSWPVMKEFDEELLAYADGKPIEYVKPLTDINGNIKYLLVCRGGSNEYTASLSDDLNINYVSPLTCILNDGGTETESSLLAEDDSPPWHTRGQFHLNDLVGACANYPEYGLLRHFRLRGFEITLSVIDVKLDKQGNPEQFNLRISLRQDVEIKSTSAEQPGFLNPHIKGRNCDKVEKGNDTRMCRDWNQGGPWAPCKD